MIICKMQRKISRHENFVEVPKLKISGIIFWMGNRHEKVTPSLGASLPEGVDNESPCHC